MKTIIRICMHTNWILLFILFVTFISPGVYTVLVIFLSIIPTIIWVIFDKKGGLKDDIIGGKGKSITEIINNENKQRRLRCKQTALRIIGSVFIVFNIIMYYIAMKEDALPAAGISLIFIAMGMYFLIFSFKYYKFVAVKNAKKLRAYFNPKKQNSFPELPINKKTAVKNNKTNKIRDSKITGCLIGGAVGGALGYSIKANSPNQTVDKSGKKETASYYSANSSGKALISYETQMTLFTAEGLLKPEGEKLTNVFESYQNWYKTQNISYSGDDFDSELMAYSELYEKRDPSKTCLSALSTGLMGKVQSPINSSKGCGAVTRVSPIAFLEKTDSVQRDKLAMQAAAITHGHPLGYLSSALLVHILNKCIFGDMKDLSKIIQNSVDEFSKAFSSAPFIDELKNIVAEAIKCSNNTSGDIQNIAKLGEGRSAEEVLAISVYCALRYKNDFSKGIISAVKHTGNITGTGEITGQILGAYLGESKINNEWKTNLELFDLIQETANAF